MSRARCIALNKPHGVLCQFSRDGDRPCLADCVPVPGVYPAGRLDTDSEGLLLLTDDGRLQARVTQPGSRRRGKLWKAYLAQVEGRPDEAAVQALRDGVELKDGRSKPARAAVVPEPARLWPRDPPIRRRANKPTTWLQLQLAEGRNRQVRRMTAAVGHPTLRLIRTAIGPLELGDLQPGAWRDLSSEEVDALWQARR